MIPPETSESIFPEIANGAKDALVLHHDCGVDFQFRVSELDGTEYLINKNHLKAWRTNLDSVAAIAGQNSFSYNTLEADPEGVYCHNDGNTLAILFAPGTFLEHNEVAGDPIFLLVNEQTCILTGTGSPAGISMIKDNLEESIATHIVTIDEKWENWAKYENVQ